MKKYPMTIGAIIFVFGLVFLAISISYGDEVYRRPPIIGYRYGERLEFPTLPMFPMPLVIIPLSPPPVYCTEPRHHDDGDYYGDCYQWQHPGYWKKIRR